MCISIPSWLLWRTLIQSIKGDGGLVSSLGTMQGGAAFMEGSPPSGFYLGYHFLKCMCTYLYTHVHTIPPPYLHILIPYSHQWYIQTTHRVGNRFPEPALPQTNLQMATSLRAGRWWIKYSATYWVYILGHVIWPLWPQLLLLGNGINNSACFIGLLEELNKMKCPAQFLATPNKSFPVI